MNATKQLALIADYEAAIRRLAKGALQQDGFHVLEVPDGAKAAGAVHTRSPDIVFLDVGMPVMNGFEACREIRKVRRDLPVVMMTGMDDVHSIKQAYDAGATDFITKPVNWELFKHRTRYLLRAHETFRAWKEAEARSEALINALPDSIAHLGPDGTVLDFRPGGRLEESAVRGESFGRAMDELVPGLLNAGCRYHIQRVADTRMPSSVEYTTKILGQQKDYEARIVPKGDRDTIIVFRDISKQKIFGRFINDHFSRPVPKSSPKTKNA